MLSLYYLMDVTLGLGDYWQLRYRCALSNGMFRDLIRMALSTSWIVFTITQCHKCFFVGLFLAHSFLSVSIGDERQSAQSPLSAKGAFLIPELKDLAFASWEVLW